MQDATLAENVAKEIELFLQSNYNIAQLSRKRLNLVDCREFMGENEALRTIQSTNFDFSVSFISTLESKKIKEKNSPQKWKLYLMLELEIFDKEQKRIGRFKGKNEAILKENNTQTQFPPLNLSETDFRSFYFQTLKKMFGKNPEIQNFDFFTQTPNYLVEFLENNPKYELTWIERLAISLKSEAKNDTIVRAGLDVDSFKENDTIIVRTARLKNPFDKKNYQLQAFTHPRKTHITQVDFYQSKNYVGSLQNNTLQNEDLTKGKILEEVITWEDFGAYKMGFYKKNLVIYALFKKNTTIEKENLGEYDLYFSKNANNNVRAMWLNVFLGESLMKFVGKYARK